MAIPTTRYTALDGLRGIAALTVVVHHSMLIDPAFAEPYRPDPHVEGAARWLAYSPLHLFWAGGEAVLVFFVLSGFVLALPFLGPRPTRWRGYYPSRILRLYLPVWGSLALAIAFYLSVDRRIQDDTSFWLVTNTLGYSPRTFLGDVTLWAPSNLNGPLWSLRLEVIFSLLLPAYLVVAVRWVRFTPALVLGAVTVAAVAPLPDDVNFLAVFAIGVVIAVRRHDVLALVSRAGRSGALAMWVLALLLPTARWWVPGPHGLTQALTVVGATLLVVVFSSLTSAHSIGDSRVVQWLGRRSFSLYLVHAPIVATVGFAFPHAGLLLWVPLSVAASLLTASAFFLVVEVPAHKAARGVARRWGRSGTDGPSVRPLPRRAA